MLHTPLVVGQSLAIGGLIFGWTLMICLLKMMTADTETKVMKPQNIIVGRKYASDIFPNTIYLGVGKSPDGKTWNAPVEKQLVIIEEEEDTESSIGHVVSTLPQADSLWESIYLIGKEPSEPSEDMDGDPTSALASAGMGTDEDYGGTDERL